MPHLYYREIVERQLVCFQSFRIALPYSSLVGVVNYCKYLE